MTRKTDMLNGAVVIPVRDPRVRLPERGLKSRGEHHITLITPPESKEIKKQKGWSSKEFEKRMTGRKVLGKPKYECLGRQRDGRNAVYFIVVDWPTGQKFRSKYGLDPSDLHVTLGFRQRDLYDVSKGKETCVGPLRSKPVRKASNR